MNTWFTRFAVAREIAPPSTPDSATDISADWVDMGGTEDPDDTSNRLHNIAPGGDIIIVLNQSIICEDFVSWPEPHKDGPSESIRDAPKLDEWLKLVIPETGEGCPATGSINEEHHAGTAQAVGGDEENGNTIGSTNEAEANINSIAEISLAAQSTEAISTNAATIVAPNTLSTVPQGRYQYQVSSADLMAASPVFKNILSSGEGIDKLRHSDGKIYFVARSVNEKVLCILLKILSHRTGGLPHKLRLSSIAMVAVLASQLECVHAVQFYADRWCGKQEQKFPVAQEVGQIVMMWLCAALVFRREDRFGEAAQVLLRNSKVALLPSLGLPIQHAIDMINDKRKETFKEAVGCLFQSHDKYADLEYVCETNTAYSEICASVMEGCISRQIRKMGLFDDRASSEKVTNRSIQDMCVRVAGIQVPKWKTYDKRTHNCDFKELKESFLKFHNVKIELKQVVGEESLG